LDAELADIPMRLTKKDELNCVRFGCVFLPKQNLICIPWQYDPQTVRSANILVRLNFSQWPSAPLLSLAFEISRTKVLPHYCYVPFDLRNKPHAKYLSSVFKSGKIELCFLADSRQIACTYEIPPYQCAAMANLYTTAMVHSKTFPSISYDFDLAVAEFEQKIRLVDFFQYAVTDSELEHLITSSKEAAAKVAPDDKADATKIATGLLEVFRPQGTFVRGLIEKVPSWRRSLLVGLDLHRHFEGDYDRFVHFLADLIAVHTPKEHNRQLETATLLFKSIFRLLNHVSDNFAKSDETSKAQIEADFQDVMARFAGGQGLSIKAVTSLLSAIGIPVGGQPGRTPKDYSSEYARKASGQTWPAVAAYTLANDRETREEFGSRAFDVLTFQEKELLKHRVREGVRSYAKRVGKTFPPVRETRLLPPLEEGQKNPL